MIPDRRAAIGRILDFWLTEVGAARWYVADATLDARITERFAALWDAARRDRPEAWLATAEGALAHLVLLDQFPRNMFRGTPRAFAADGLARDVARGAIDAGFDGALTPAQRLFLYLPFEHSENAADQALAVQLIESLGNESWTHYARAHQSLIERFGRFPHRNAILGRASTAEEEEALNGPMGSF